MAIKLNGTERHILYTVLMNGSLNVPQIARQVGCHAPTVHHAIRKFKAAGLISRRIMVDIFRLGYARHAIYITLSSEGQEKKPDIARFLTNSSCTTVVLEVGGEYDFFVATVTRTSAELAAFNHELSSRFGSLFLKKDVAVTVRHSVFGEKMLVDNPDVYTECFYEVDHSLSNTIVQLDAVDHQLLYTLAGPQITSNCGLAQSLGMAQSTFVYRLKRLESAQVICGDMHEIRGELIGLTNYIILVGMKGVSQKTQVDFHQFARQHRNIAHLSFEVGHWDYMLGVAVEEQKDLNALIDTIRREFRDSIASIKSFSMFYAHKVRDYPIIPEAMTAQARHVSNSNR
jgi:DNA-binding Lrp family transcriptional regulator